MFFLYSLIVHSLGLIYRLGSWFNPKIKTIQSGRKKAWDVIQKPYQSPSKKLLWFHVASLGEFEQVRPLIDTFFEDGQFNIALSFSSSSGYEIRKDYPRIHRCFYLPLDTHKNAQTLLNLLNPDGVIWVKYDFWFHILKEIQKRKIPLFLVCASFRRDQYFFKSSGKTFLKILMKFDQIHTLNHETFDLLQKNQFKNLYSSGDLRIQSVIRRKAKKEKIAFLENLRHKKKLIVLGSTHTSDMQMIEEFVKLKKDHLIIIAPHEIKGTHIDRLKNNFGSDSVFWSEIDDAASAISKIIIVDSIGNLFDIYEYADVVYIGGGFGSGIHNTLEPAVFYKPIIFGPRYEKFDEARLFIQNKMAFSISESEQLKAVLAHLKNKEVYDQVILAYAEYFNAQTNYVESIYREIKRISG